MYLHLALQQVLLRKRALTSSVALQIVQILERYILYKNKLIIGLGLPELDTIKIGAEGECYQEVSNSKLKSNKMSLLFIAVPTFWVNKSSVICGEGP